MRARLYRAVGPALATLALAVAGPALAQGSLKVSRLVEQGRVVAEVRTKGLVDADLRERIKSGLTNRLVFEAKLVSEGLNAPALFSVTHTIEIVFDLWDENYLVTFHEGGPPRVVKIATLKEVAQLLERPYRIELGSAAACDPEKKYRVDTVLTVNPVSERVMQRSREMISPAPGERGGTQSRSLFGSVARIFFNVSADPGVRVLRGLTPYTKVKVKRGGR